MGWDKGVKYDKKDELLQDFEAAVKRLSDDIIRYHPDAGMAALAYMVACVYVTPTKVRFDKMVKFYVGKINKDILGEKLNEAMARGDTDSIIAHLQAQLRKARK
jgi:hypothetical protein